MTRYHFTNPPTKLQYEKAINEVLDTFRRDLEIESNRYRKQFIEVTSHREVLPDDLLEMQNKHDEINSTLRRVFVDAVFEITEEYKKLGGTIE